MSKIIQRKRCNIPMDIKHVRKKQDKRNQTKQKPCLMPRGSLLLKSTPGSRLKIVNPS